MEPVTVCIADAIKAIGCGRAKLYQLIASGELRTVRLGKRRLVRTDSIRELVEKFTVSVPSDEA